MSSKASKAILAVSILTAFVSTSAHAMSREEGKQCFTKIYGKEPSSEREYYTLLGINVDAIKDGLSSSDAENIGRGIEKKADELFNTKSCETFVSQIKVMASAVNQSVVVLSEHTKSLRAERAKLQGVLAPEIDADDSGN